ncbi:hypothetical protein AB4254_09140 [Vibrio breoganii]
MQTTSILRAGRSQVARQVGVSTNKVRQSNIGGVAPIVGENKESMPLVDRWFEGMRERPRLIGELAERHRDMSILLVGRNLLSNVTKELLSMREILKNEGVLSPQDGHALDCSRKQIIRLLNTKLFGSYVLDSSFQLVSPYGNYITFSVPGFNLTRSAYEDEYLIMVLCLKAINVSFDSTVSDGHMIAHLREVFGSLGISVSLAGDEDKTILLSMRDELWRLWDKTLLITGQGARYADNGHVPYFAIPNVLTVDSIINFSVQERDKSLLLVERLITYLQSIYTQSNDIFDLDSEASDKLIDLCIQDRELESKAFLAEVKDNPVSAYIQLKRTARNVTKSKAISVLL